MGYGKFIDKNVIVTGSSGGAGQIIAAEFAREGANLFLTDREDSTKTIELIRSFGSEAYFIRCDITNESDVKKMAVEAGRHFDNRVDILINNAGFNGRTSLIQDMDIDNWNYTLKVNLTGTMLVCREILPFMIERKSGAIVNMSSNVGKRGLPYRGDYVCSKWAVIGLTQTLALEVIGDNIRVNAVCPGPIEGDRIEELMRMHAAAEGKAFDEVYREWLDVPMKRFSRPEEVADDIKFLCSDGASSLTGQALNVSGGLIMS